MIRGLKTIGYLFALLLVVISCNKVNPSKVEKLMTVGTWKLTLFSEDGVNETSHFSGYTFTFSDGGIVTAVGSSTISGPWSVQKVTPVAVMMRFILIFRFPQQMTFMN